MPTRTAAALLLLIGACSQDPPPSGPLADTLVRARQRGVLALVHFRRPDRPACVAMSTDAEQPRVRAAEAAFEPVTFDPRAEPALFAGLVGGCGGLATVVIDPWPAAPLAVLAGYAQPDDYVAFLERAVTRGGDLRAARAAAAAAPDDGAAHLRLGELLQELDCDVEARRALLRAAHDAAPLTRAAACERLARAEIERGDARAARDWLARYRALASDDQSRRLAACLTEGLVLLAERRAAQAATLLADAADTPLTQVEGIDLRLTLARARHEAGEDEAALATLHQIVADASEPRHAQLARTHITHVLTPEPGHGH